MLIPYPNKSQLSPFVQTPRFLIQKKEFENTFKNQMFLLMLQSYPQIKCYSAIRTIYLPCGHPWLGVAYFKSYQNPYF